MPSPNSDEFHIAYIYLNIMFGQGAWDHATFQAVWPGLHFYLSWKIFQLSLFWFRERWDQMHRQQLGPTMVVMQNDVWINMRLEDFFRLEERTECWSEKNSSWRLAGDIWSAFKRAYVDQCCHWLWVPRGCHEHHEHRTSDRLRLPELPEVCSRSFTCEGQWKKRCP